MIQWDSMTTFAQSIFLKIGLVPKKLLDIEKVKCDHYFNAYRTFEAQLRSAAKKNHALPVLTPRVDTYNPIAPDDYYIDVGISHYAMRHRMPLKELELLKDNPQYRQYVAEYLANKWSRAAYEVIDEALKQLKDDRLSLKNRG